LRVTVTTVELLTETPLTPPAELGPYRRQDYEALPDEPRCELIFGRIYVSPSPLLLHQMVVFVLHLLLDRIAESTGALVAEAPLDVHLADHSVVQPDVIYISAARRGIVQNWIEGAPDILVEVLSPGTGRRDRGEKLSLYAQSGVREYWIVDPQERLIQFLVNEAGRFLVAVPTGNEYRSQTLSEIHLDVPAFWREVDRRLGVA
jgi:Uma2 family endonuclease